MKTKNTIITLAALSLGVAATQAGRGNTITVTGATNSPQEQHGSHKAHTFNLGAVWAYKIIGYSYTLETIDKSSPGTFINVSSTGGTDEFKIEIPLKRKDPTTATVTFANAIVYGSDDLNIVYSWEHGASSFGSITLNASVTPSPPKILGNLDIPLVLTPKDTPHVKWDAQILFSDK